ncbi:MAG: amino acid adenylation domain-containing protein, partial [Stigonema ocellatum SAG 48.90 = DSM 106950]|nr:amino acid adenylation domain-containing protein [Stigonema ocellatum SAG 48.90 = DSM 106950]
MYTSGSTGTPKGVPISHHSLATHCQHIQKYYGIDSTDRVLQFTSLNFDPSLEQIFTTLIAGATLFVRDTEVWTAAQFTEKLLANRLSVINLPPVYWQQLIQHWVNQREQMLNHQLKLVIVGGEEMPPQALRLWNQSPVNGVRLLNVYGPTEATIIATSFEISPPFLQLPLVHNIPIGRPLANRKVYILDTDGNPVPIGVPGELHLGGLGLSTGYLHQKQLSSEKFLTDPFSNKPGSRLYKTGDLARYLSDGNIEYLGRIDNQVKIRGFRIELGEIEAVLNTHPQIQQAVVIAKENIPGNTRLVGYVVPSDKSLTTSQLSEFLKQKLPEYMVPAAFVTLDTLPLTPNGKIDFKALPTPDGEITREHVKVTPRTPSEEIIANVFAAVLGMQNVGIHDNFFTNGGHSLLATQLISRLRVAFAVEIPIRAVFESPTIAQLDQTITQLRTQDLGLTLPPIQPIEGDTEQIPLSWAQQRLWFLNQLEGSTATYNIPAAVRIAGNLDLKTLQQALSEIVRRHEILRTSFQTVNGTPIQVIHPEATMNINVVDLQQLSVTERETVLHQQVELEAITPFDLEIVPLIRCSVLHICATEYVLLLTMHHIVSDGWSIGVFISELSALYQAACNGVPSPLPELPIQYADFAVWQRQWLSGVVLDTQLNYWRTQLYGAPLLLQLPTDRPRPVVQTYQGATQSLTLNTDLAQKLQSLSRESGTTLFMTLLAAFSTLLYRYSGQSDILVGTPIANRNRSEVENLIGFFVNTLVLRTSFSDNPTFESLLSQVRETTLKAYEHQDVPFEQVVEA